MTYFVVDNGTVIHQGTSEKIARMIWTDRRYAIKPEYRGNVRLYEARQVAE